MININKNLKEKFIGKELIIESIEKIFAKNLHKFKINFPNEKFIFKISNITIVVR